MRGAGSGRRSGSQESMTVSEVPSPYEAAVSIQSIPAEAARSSAANASAWPRCMSDPAATEDDGRNLEPGPTEAPPLHACSSVR